MDKKEYVNSFIDTLRQGDEAKLYKFFTSRTKVMIVNGTKEISLDETISYLKETFFNEDIVVGRIFESSVCIKIELKAPKFTYDALLIEIADRRIKRLEIM